MAAVTICSDFRAQEEEICHCVHLFPFYLLWSNEAGCVILVFLIFSFKLTLSLSSFTLAKRLLSSFSLSAIRVVPSVSLRLLTFLLPTGFQLGTHPAWHCPCVQHTIKQTRWAHRALCPTPFSILNQSVIPYRVHQILPIQAFPLHSFLNYHQFTYITEFWLLIFKSFC